MDMTRLEVSSDCRVGDEVVLLGAQGEGCISAVELARWSGTIPWEIVSGFSKRVPRVWVERPLPLGEPRCAASAQV
jgi:alanine racemase